MLIVKIQGLEGEHISMIKTELLPTKENLIKTFLEDSIGRNEDLFHFIRLLNSITTTYSLAVDGNWGSGKTFFIKQAKMILDVYNVYTQVEHELDDEDAKKILLQWERINRNRIDVKNFVSVYFDAWEYDSDQEPIESLLYQISKDVSSEYKISSERSYIDIALSIIELFTTKNYKVLLDDLKGSNIIERIEGNKNVQELINNYFNNLLPEHGDRLIIFIDELDRCNPNYAVRLLERIKHYFNNEKITFVFSINKEQLRHTIKQHYGNDFNSYKYLDRFFDLTVNIPKLNMEKYYSCSGIHFEKETIEQMAVFLANKYNMQMREVSRYLYAIDIATNMYGKTSNSVSTDFCNCFVLPIAMALKQYDLDLYNDFIQGKAFDEFYSILSNEDFSYAISGAYLSKSFVEIEPNIKSYLKEFYDAIFNEKYANDPYKNVGRARFSKQNKETLLNQLGLLTEKSLF